MKLRYGIIDENVRKRSVRDVILREGLLKADSADNICFKGVFSAVSPMVSSAPAGKLAFHAAVNHLAADRLLAEAFFASILLPFGTQEDALRDIIRQICREARPLGIRVQEGNAEVTDAVAKKVVIGTAAGNSFCNNDPGTDHHSDGKSDPDPDKNDTARGKKGIRGPNDAGDVKKAGDHAGMEIVMAGFAGMEGTYILTCEAADELEKRFPEPFLRRARSSGDFLSVVKAAETACMDENTGFMEALSDGGIFTGLWKLSAKTGCGMEVCLQDIPLLQETIEITNYCGINPYMMRSLGGLLITSKDGAALAESLRDRGIHAARIGILHNRKDRILLNGENVRYLDRPQTDSLAEYLHRKNLSSGSSFR